jgi:hypothetical protein
MKKYVSLMILLIMVTVYFKDGSIAKYNWANGFFMTEHWNKVFYTLIEDGFLERKFVSIPSDNVLRVEKE